MKKNIILIGLFLFMCTSMFAQGDFRFSEQMFSRINQNPAGIGNNENIQLFTATRLQWVGQGLETSPTSALLNAHYYVDKIKSGFGLSFVYDELGMMNQTINAKLCYAYNIDFYENGLLSLGLSAGVINKTFDPNRHIWKDDNDPMKPGEIEGKTTFDLDFGIEYSYKYIMVGASVTHLPSIASEVSTYTAPSHINVYARGMAPLPKDFALIPAVLYTNIGALNKPGTVNGYKLAQENLVDVSLTAMYQGKYWFGVGYRINTNVSLMAGFEWKWLRVGYCYDLSVGPVFNFSTSTHEVMLSFIIPTKKDYQWQ